MVFKNFYSQIGLRLSLLVASVIFTTWLVVSGQKLIFSLNFLILSILQFGWLLWYLNKWNRELHDFFRGLKESSYEIPRHLGWKWIRPMEQPLTELKEYLRKQQEQKEVENEYFRVMSEQVATGILVFDEEWNVGFSNKAILQLLDIEAIRNVNTLERSNPEIVRLLKDLLPGNTTEFVLHAHQDPRVLMIRTSEFITAKKRYKVFVFDNIQQLINRKEVESWQKLIRVLNHEIMNSIGPINSTTELLIEKWEGDIEDAKQQKQLAAKTIKGLAVIGERSKSLAEFVNAYRSLTKNPVPDIDWIDLTELIIEIIQLYDNDFKKLGIQLELKLEKNINIQADRSFLEQIFVNIIKNSIEAFGGMDQVLKSISIYALNTSTSCFVTIKDNGKGMSDEVLESAFVPFYTTKDDGNGIGLSLARQLMFAMEGSLEIRSRVGEGTEVRLMF